MPADGRDTPPPSPLCQIPPVNYTALLARFAWSLCEGGGVTPCTAEANAVGSSTRNESGQIDDRDDGDRQPGDDEDNSDTDFLPTAGFVPN